MFSHQISSDSCQNPPLPDLRRCDLLKGVGRDEIGSRWTLPTFAEIEECRQLFQLIREIRPAAVTDMIAQIQEARLRIEDSFYMDEYIEFIVGVKVIFCSFRFE